MSQPPPPPSLSRVLISRILGVTSIGAAIGVVYLIWQRNKNNDLQDPPTTPPPDSASTTSATSALSNRKKKRMSSGERNRVTFSDQNEIICTDTPSPIQIQQEEPQSHPQQQQELVSKKDEIELDGNLVTRGREIRLDPREVDVDVDIEVKGQVQIEVNPNKTEDSDVAAEQNNHAQDAKTSPSPVKEVMQSSNAPAAAATSAANGNGHFAQHGLTPETDYDRTGITRELQISRDHVPGLIGRKGTNIRAIQQDSNTLITFKDETLENGDRICQIRGQPQDVTVAESLIEKHVLDQPVLTSTTMHVPHSSVGRIIGKGGESIRGIQDLSKAKVNVDTGNQFHNRGGADAVRMVTVTLRGTEEQIDFARQMIIEKVDEEKALRRNIDIMTQNRAPRRSTGGGGSTSSSPANNSPSATAAVNGNHSSLPNFLRSGSGVLEVFVSCAYHPNDFWIQVMGRESIELDKLTEHMTQWYSGARPEEVNLTVGEIVAAPFDVDGKMYRGKILKLDDATEYVEVCYVDYGDKRVISRTAVRRIQPEFLKIRFQAIQATLNLGSVGERWSDEAIVAFCDLTYCAQWQSLTAKVKEYMKPCNDSNETVLWVELLDKDLNIGNSLISRGLANPTPTPNDALLSSTSLSPFYDNSFPSSNNPSMSTPTPTSPPSTTSSHNSSKKSYASIAKEQLSQDQEQDDGSSSISTREQEEGHWEDSANGN